MKKMLDAVFEALVKTGVDFQSHHHRLMKNIAAASQPEPCSSGSRATSLDPTTWAATLSRVQDAAQLTHLPQKLLEGGESSFLAEKKVSSPSGTSRKDLSGDSTAAGSIFDIEVNREFQRNFYSFYLDGVEAKDTRGSEVWQKPVSTVDTSFFRGQDEINTKIISVYNI